MTANMTPAEKRKAFNAERARQVKQRKLLQEELYSNLSDLLQQVEAEIQAQMQNNPTDWQTWQLRKLKAEINRLLTALGVKSESLVIESANRTWQAGIDLIDKPLAAAAVEFVGLAPLVNLQQLEAIRFFMVDKIKDVASDAAKAIGQQLELAAMGAIDLQTLQKGIASRLTEDADYRAKMIVQTELGRLYGVSSQARLDQAGFVPGLKKQWKRSNRRKPRLSHAVANNQVQPVDKPFIIGKVLMMHPHDPKAPASEVIRCGCMMVPFMDEWDE